MKAKALQKGRTVYLMNGVCDEFCPVIELTEDEVTLQDDEGNTFHISPTHWNVLIEKVLEGDLGPVV